MKNLLSLLVALALHSCAPVHYYHLPNVLHVPAVQQKGDFELNGILNSNFEWEAHTGYAITNRILAVCNHQQLRKGQRTLESDWVKGYYTEIGTGYHRSDQGSSISLIGLLGNGYILNNFAPDVRADLQFSKLALQFGYAYRGTIFRFDAGIRAGQVRVNRGSINRSAPFEAFENFEMLKSNRNIEFVGVGLSGGTGRDPVFLNMFVALERSFVSLSRGYWGNGQVGLGLTFVLETQKKRKKKATDRFRELD